MASKMVSKEQVYNVTKVEISKLTKSPIGYEVNIRVTSSLGDKIISLFSEDKDSLQLVKVDQDYLDIHPIKVGETK